MSVGGATKCIFICYGIRGSVEEEVELKCYDLCECALFLFKLFIHYYSILLLVRCKIPLNINKIHLMLNGCVLFHLKK